MYGTFSTHEGDKKYLPDSGWENQKETRSRETGLDFFKKYCVKGLTGFSWLIIGSCGRIL
jgi:hypothetical protein